MNFSFFLPDPHFAVLDFTEIGGDHLDRLIARADGPVISESADDLRSAFVAELCEQSTYLLREAQTCAYFLNCFSLLGRGAVDESALSALRGRLGYLDRTMGGVAVSVFCARIDEAAASWNELDLRAEIRNRGGTVPAENYVERFGSALREVNLESAEPDELQKLVFELIRVLLVPISGELERLKVSGVFLAENLEAGARTEEGRLPQLSVPGILRTFFHLLVDAAGSRPLENTGTGTGEVAALGIILKLLGEKGRVSESDFWQFIEAETDNPELISSVGDLSDLIDLWPSMSEALVDIRICKSGLPLELRSPGMSPIVSSEVALRTIATFIREKRGKNERKEFTFLSKELQRKFRQCCEKLER